MHIVAFFVLTQTLSMEQCKRHAFCGTAVDGIWATKEQVELPVSTPTGCVKPGPSKTPPIENADEAFGVCAVSVLLSEVLTMRFESEHIDSHRWASEARIFKAVIEKDLADPKLCQSRLELQIAAQSASDAELRTRAHCNMVPVDGCGST